MNNEGKFTKYKKLFVLATSLAIAWISALNSKNGFVNNEASTSLEVMGWAFSAACMAAQFMFTSEFRRLNWTVIFLGACAYLYSIPTNYLGLETWRGTVTGTSDLVNWIAAIFMDVYPEAALAWALGESKLGDMLGNLFRAANRSDELTNEVYQYGQETVRPRQAQRPSTPPQRQPEQRRPAPVSNRPTQAPPTYHPIGYFRDDEEG